MIEVFLAGIANGIILPPLAIILVAKSHTP